MTDHWHLSLALQNLLKCSKILQVKMKISRVHVSFLASVILDNLARPIASATFLIGFMPSINQAHRHKSIPEREMR